MGGNFLGRPQIVPECYMWKHKPLIEASYSRKVMEIKALVDCFSLLSQLEANIMVAPM